jgi:hypothetical protein
MTSGLPVEMTEPARDGRSRSIHVVSVTVACSNHEKYVREAYRVVFTWAVLGPEFMRRAYRVVRRLVTLGGQRSGHEAPN